MKITEKELNALSSAIQLFEALAIDFDYNAADAEATKNFKEVKMCTAIAAKQRNQAKAIESLMDKLYNAADGRKS